MANVTAYSGYICNENDLAEQFGVKSPKEQIISAYNKYGTDVPKHIQGMFAFTIEDNDNNLVLGARDRFGTRSLYYYITEDNKLLTALSIREMIDKPGFVKEFNHDALELFLSFSYLPGNTTFFKNLYKVMPGEMLIYKDNKLEIKKYWGLKITQDKSLSFDEYAEAINNALVNAAPDWRHNAKTFGNFLSGGVDSGYLTAIMGSKETFSAGYDDPAFDESPMAKESAEALGVANKCFKITPDQYFSVIPDVMRSMEQPLGDASCIVFYLACKEAAKHVDVCYSGEGADELFCGYHAYVRRLKQLAEAKPGDVIPKVEDFYIGNTKVFHEDGKKQILKEYNGKIMPLDLAKSLYNPTEDMDDVTKIALCDLNVWFEGDIMLNAEKMALANNLDCRTPFLDYRVVDIALKIPSEFRADTKQTKLVFRKAATHLLPEVITNRPKIGFAVPARTWITMEPYKSQIKELFESDIAEKFFNKEAILQMLNDDVILNNWRKIWLVYVFIIWYKEYFA